MNLELNHPAGGAGFDTKAARSGVNDDMVNIAGNQFADQAPEFTYEKFAAAVRGADQVSRSKFQPVDHVFVDHVSPHYIMDSNPQTQKLTK